MTDGEVRDAIRYGLALAAWTCGFEGARGGMYEAEKPRFELEIAALLGKNGGGTTVANGRQSKTQNGVSCWCPSCGQLEQLAIRPRKAADRAEGVTP
jgi:fructokinase